jgi:hypothetical protein
MLLAQPAFAVDPDSRVTPASYTTGRTGQQLKWLPIRPADTGAVKQAVATEDLGVPAALPSPRPVSSAPAGAFADPFGDSRKSARPAPAGKLSRVLAQEAPAKPLPGSAGPTPAGEQRKLPLPGPETEEPKPKPADELAQARQATCPDTTKKKNRAGRTVTEDEYYKGLLDEVQPSVKSGEALPLSCKAEAPRPYDDRRWWSRTPFLWKASALCHKPAYFEDEGLERYGHAWGPWIQPFVSAGHFYLELPIMPYIMGLYPPNECIYTLGYYRPGDCAPYTIDPLPLSIRAAVLEGGVWTGMVFLIP